MQVIDNKLKYDENVNHSTLVFEMQNSNNNIDTNRKIEPKKDLIILHSLGNTKKKKDYIFPGYLQLYNLLQ